MPTYVYETTGPTHRRFEVKQSMMDAPLTHDPETGEPVVRVISGGFGYLGKSKEPAPTPAPARSGGGGGCCGGHCGRNH